MNQILLLAGAESKIISLKVMTVIGGESSTGVRLPNLKHKGDYAVLSPVGGRVSIHGLRSGFGSGDLRPLAVLRLEDLTIVSLGALDETASADSGGPGENRTDVVIAELLQNLSTDQSLKDSLTQVLAVFTRLTETESGMVVVRDDRGRFRVMAEHNMDAQENWLGESLFQKVVQTREPQQALNLVGSPFSSNESLMASGFLSVFAWPLLVRGEVLGVIMVGSAKPHSGLNSQQLAQIPVCVATTAVVLFFLLSEKQARVEVQTLRRQIHRGERALLSSDSRVLQACDLAARIAPTELSVLILGETGVGKEVMARWIHDHSDRASGPFVPVNCGAIPAELLESVLFGHKKGSFTGAIRDQQGKFQQAHGGTLFLDEIGDLPAPLQVKILRALQERKVDPVGAAQPVAVDVRILAATHRDLPRMMAGGEFREDLFYRIDEVQVEIPPLRERRADVELLAMDYLKRYASGVTLSREAVMWLSQQKWSGNVRELFSHLKRAVVLCSGDVVEVSDLSLGRPAPRPHPAPESLDAPGLEEMNLERAKDLFLKHKILLALQVSGGHRAKAAEALGVTPRTLFRYLKELQIQDDSAVTNGLTV